MVVMTEYEVIEDYDDQAPEVFGIQLFEHTPQVGSIVQLKWLSGKDAHRVVVTAVDPRSQSLRVKAAPNQV